MYLHESWLIIASKKQQFGFRSENNSAGNLAGILLRGFFVDYQQRIQKRFSGRQRDARLKSAEIDVNSVHQAYGRFLWLRLAIAGMPKLEPHPLYFDPIVACSQGNLKVGVSQLADEFVFDAKIPPIGNSEELPQFLQP